ncbi:MAG: heme exporter protein CcmD [Alphaproteobacteria bacterium]|nr:heme exporter protein CcmD [Alphaproteobacteria bacterium]
MAEFLNMGGYAGFIWPAWGIGVGVMLVITIISARQSRAMNAQLAAESDN